MSVLCSFSLSYVRTKQSIKNLYLCYEIKRQKDINRFYSAWPTLNSGTSTDLFLSAVHKAVCVCVWMGASLCVHDQLDWGLILLFHSSRVTNRINSGLPTEQGDTLAGLFKESITGDGSATDPIVPQPASIHAQYKEKEHKRSYFGRRLQPTVIQQFGPHKQQDNKVSFDILSEHITFSELLAGNWKSKSSLFSHIASF